MRETVPNPIELRMEISGPRGKPPTPEVLALAKGIKDAMKGAIESLQAQGGAMPGEFTAWDDAAWERLQGRVGRCRCAEGTQDPCPLEGWMLMCHLSPSVAEFKKRHHEPPFQNEILRV